MTWTKKHAEFCLNCKFRPSSTVITGWVLRRANPNEVSEIEVDLRVLNTWAKRWRGTPYDRKTIREAIQQIDECSDGLILISKDYTPWIKKLVVRPLSLVTQKKPIRSAEALFITCLERKLYEGFSLYYQAELPYFDSASKIGDFVRDLLPDKSPSYQT